MKNEKISSTWVSQIPGCFFTSIWRSDWVFMLNISSKTLSQVRDLLQKEKEKKIMNASVAIQVLPKVNNDEETIRIVDEVLEYIKSTGLSYFVGPCETAIEGDYDELMEVVKECQKVAVRAGAKSVSAYVKINYRPEGEVLSIEKKVTKHHQ